MCACRGDLADFLIVYKLVDKSACALSSCELVRISILRFGPVVILTVELIVGFLTTRLCHFRRDEIPRDNAIAAGIRTYRRARGAPLLPRRQRVNVSRRLIAAASIGIVMTYRRHKAAGSWPVSDFDEARPEIRRRLGDSALVRSACSRVPWAHEYINNVVDIARRVAIGGWRRRAPHRRRLIMKTSIKSCNDVAAAVASANIGVRPSRNPTGGEYGPEIVERSVVVSKYRSWKSRAGGTRYRSSE